MQSGELREDSGKQRGFERETRRGSMIRTIITIDEEKCNGCGLCAAACHEGAIAIIDGKAKLVRDNFCDGLGDCLPSCPTGAITFTEREAAAYDEAAVLEHQKKAKEAMTSAPSPAHPHTGGCPGALARSLIPAAAAPAEAAPGTNEPSAPSNVPSQLGNWPVQIKLAPTSAPYFQNANLLIAADCCAYAYGNFHQDFIRNKVAVIGCPKLDGTDYSEKLAAIIAENDIKSVTIARMEVPCCSGIETMAKNALQASGKFIPWQVVTFSLDGRILD